MNFSLLRKSGKNVSASTPSTDDGVDAETFLPDFLNKLNFMHHFCVFWKDFSTIMHVKSKRSFNLLKPLLSCCKNRFRLSQLIKILNSMERGALFRHFCVSKVITTAHAHNSGVIFHIFKSFQTKKIKALRPKTTEIASRGGSCLNQEYRN